MKKKINNHLPPLPPKDPIVIREEVLPQPQSLLLSLPVELIGHILSGVRGTRARISPALASRRLYFCAKPLFRVITLDCFEEVKRILTWKELAVTLVKDKQTGGLYCLKRYPLRYYDPLAAKIVSANAKKRVPSHPFVQQVHATFYASGSLYFVCDYINGHELSDSLSPQNLISKHQTKLITAELVSALCHIHKYGVLYRSIRAENILVDTQGHVAFIGFNQSKILDADNSSDASEKRFFFDGVQEYLAVEILKGERYGLKSDVWALGVLAYELYTGLPAFYSQDVSELYSNIVKGSLVIPPDMDPAFADLMRGMLRTDQTIRWSAEQTKKAAYFSDIDWAKLDRKEYEMTPLALNTPFWHRQNETQEPTANLTKADQALLADFSWLADDSPL